MSLDSRATKVSRTVHEKTGRLLSCIEFSLCHLANPDEVVAPHYFFGDPKKELSHEFFMSRKHEAFAKLNFEKRELTLRLGTDLDAAQMKYSFECICSGQFDLDHYLKSDTERPFFEPVFYEKLGVDRDYFWTNVLFFISNETLIRDFFCFPVDISNISSK